MRTLKFIVPAVYILGAIFVWIDFVRTPPDGLANFGIALYTLPLVEIGGWISGREFPFFGGDYYHAHAVYFVAGVLLDSILLFAVMSAAQRWRPQDSYKNEK